jgi:hypothetical protein
MGQSLSDEFIGDQADLSLSEIPQKLPQSHEILTEGNTDTTHDDFAHKDQLLSFSLEQSPSSYNRLEGEAYVKPFHADSHQPKRAGVYAQNFKSSVTDYSQDLDEQTRAESRQNLHEIPGLKDISRRNLKGKYSVYSENEVSKSLFNLPNSLNNLKGEAKFEISQKCEPKLIKDSFFEGRESMIATLKVFENTGTSFGKLYRIESVLSSSSNLEFDVRMN